MQTLLQTYQSQWNKLSDTWKMALNEAALQRKSSLEMPDEDGLQRIFNAPALRFAGPKAPYPNMTLELEDLTGLEAMKKLEILVVSHHKIRSLEDIAALKHLKSLFVFDNQIAALDGVENLTNLVELYCHNNQIRSLKPLENLTGLQKLYCSGNLITSLDGIGPQHAESMIQFNCIPNAGLRDAEIMRFEREAGIRCLKG